MNQDKNRLIKLGFGLLIFMFALALAYFTAHYSDANGYFDYWYTLAVFAGVYVLIGTLVSSIFPISLGFLFSSTLLLLHVFFERYADISNIFKSLLLGSILILLYLSAWFKTNDEPSQPQPPLQQPPSLQPQPQSPSQPQSQ